MNRFVRSSTKNPIAQRARAKITWERTNSRSGSGGWEAAEGDGWL